MIETLVSIEYRNRDISLTDGCLYFRQYFIVAFKDKPLELWDLHTLTMLRETGKSLPHPTALEWSPSHSLKSLKKKMMGQTGEKEAGQGASTPGGGDCIGGSAPTLPETPDRQG